VLFYPPDPGSGSGMEQWSDPDPGSGIKHPGSATLACTNFVHKADALFLQGQIC
jgi:hypothetical protein